MMKVCSFALNANKVIRVLSTILLLGVITAPAWCQAESSALKSLHKSKWDKSRTSLARALRKDSVSAGAHYVLARYFFTLANPDFNLDSAHFYALRAFRYFEHTSPKQRERLRKLPLDSLQLTTLREAIDSAAFARAKQVNTETGFIFFLENFSSAVQREEALALRDEAAFLDAIRENTHTAFARFLEKYPQTIHTREANDYYEILLYEDRTRDQRLQSFVGFLRERPHSPFRPQAEEQILFLHTASGEPEKFLQFISDYPSGKAAARAKDILYHISHEIGEGFFPDHLYTDSLHHIHALNEDYLVPFLSNGRFGFMNQSGKEIIAAAVDDIDKNYLCGNITEDVLVLDGKVLARNGSVIFEGSVIEIDDLGSGFLMIITGECNYVLHKSGFTVGAGCVEDARILGRKFVAIKQEQWWSLYSLAGKLLLPQEWDDCKEIQNVISLRKGDKWFLITPSSLGGVANREPLKISPAFDEVKSFSGGQLWVKAGEDEGLLDNDLHTSYPLRSQIIEPAFFGLRSQSSSGIQVWEYTHGASGYFQDVVVNYPWVTVKSQDKWRLFDPAAKKFFSREYDSILFTGIFATGRTGDSVYVHFDRQFSQKFSKVKLDFLPGRDSVAFLLVEDGAKKMVFSAKGQKLFEFTADRIQYAGHSTFIVSKKEKKGLISSNGKPLLPITYDAIGEADGDYIPLLRSMKFGVYHVRSKKEIKPAYEKNLRRFNDQLLVAHKNRNIGFIDLNDKIKIPFEYSDFFYWNDSSVFLKKDKHWVLMEIASKKIILDQVRDYKWVRNADKEKVVIVRRGDFYGVISNSRGVIIPVTFTDIVNVGSSDEPLYLTEKHVEEAYYYVVVYYDKDGKLIRRQVFEIDDYERIYCSHN